MRRAALTLCVLSSLAMGCYGVADARVELKLNGVVVDEQNRPRTGVNVFFVDRGLNDFGSSRKFIGVTDAMGRLQTTVEHRYGIKLVALQDGDHNWQRANTFDLEFEATPGKMQTLKFGALSESQIQGTRPIAFRFRLSR